MSKIFRLGLFAGLLGVLFVSTGCATKNSTKSRINALEAQVGVLTDEVTKLDQELQQARGGQTQTAASSYTGGRATSATAVYKTPSGFELPSADIQKALKGAGYYQGTVDGKIGAATKNAVKAFQKDHGLGPDGVVGQRTWEKLKVYLTSSTN